MASVVTGALLESDDGSASPTAAATSKIAFIESRPGYHVGLYVVNADGSQMRRLLETARSDPAIPYELGSPPGWSPDGRSIAFVGKRDDGNVDVYVVGADGHGQRRLTRHPAVEGNPAWSPDGRTIAFTRQGESRFEYPSYQIYVMNADGSGQRRLTRNGWIHLSVAWSPDGRKMLFERPDFPHTGAEEVWSMNADGSANGD